jgi:hypothetical protein
LSLFPINPARHSSIVLKKQTKRITIDLPLDIHARVTEIADSEDRSIRNYIFRLIKLDIMARERDQEEQKEE